jgi:hypothetical protein
MNITEIKKKLSSDSFITNIIEIAYDPELRTTKFDLIRRMIFNALTGKHWDDVDCESNVKRYKVVLYNKTNPDLIWNVNVSAISKELAETYATSNGNKDNWGLVGSYEIPND